MSYDNGIDIDIDDSWEIFSLRNWFHGKKNYKTTKQLVFFIFRE